MAIKTKKLKSYQKVYESFVKVSGEKELVRKKLVYCRGDTVEKQVGVQSKKHTFLDQQKTASLKSLFSQKLHKIKYPTVKIPSVIKDQIKIKSSPR